MLWLYLLESDSSWLPPWAQGYMATDFVWKCLLYSSGLSDHEAMERAHYRFLCFCSQAQVQVSLELKLGNMHAKCHLCTERYVRPHHTRYRKDMNDINKLCFLLQVVGMQ